MLRRVLLVAGIAVLFALPSCQFLLGTFQVPPVAVAGSTFEIKTTLKTPSPPTLGAAIAAAVVIQLPTGFVVDTFTLAPPSAVTVDNPAVLVLFNAEPGHYLKSYSASGGVQIPGLRLRVTAPVTPGIHTIKVATADQFTGAWQIRDPGPSNFALITTAPHRQTLRVVAPTSVLVPPFVDSSAGLPVVSTAGFSSIATGDVDGDGVPDLAVSSGHAMNPRVYVRSGNGWTLASAGLARPTFFSASDCDVAFGDVNGDGHLDLADGAGYVFLGDGAGGWTAVTAGLPNDQAIVSYGGAAVGDVNGDGFADVALGGVTTPRLRVFLWNGVDGFTESSNGLPTTPPPGATGVGGRRLRMLDMNGDGNLDLVWNRVGTPAIYLGDGMGNWTPVEYAGNLGVSFSGLDAADVDGDGDRDLVVGVAIVNVGVANGTEGIRLYRQQAGPSGPQWVYDPTSGLPTTEFYGDVVFADVDQDGFLDVLASRRTPVGRLEIWRGLGGGRFALRHTGDDELPPVGDVFTRSLATGDFDGDGVLDFAHAVKLRRVEAFLRLPVAPACASGTVGAAIGAPESVVFVNGSDGGLQRVVPIDFGLPLATGVAKPATQPGSGSAFILWGILGFADGSAAFPTPIGPLCFTPHAVAVGTPGLFTIFNSFNPIDPLAFFPAGPAPFAAAGPGLVFPFAITMQGVILDPGGPTGVAAITNAVHVVVRP